MTDTVALAKKYYQAFAAKDKTTIRALLAKNFHFKGPMMETTGVEEMVGCMDSCPMVGGPQNMTFVAEGNRVVQIFDWVVTAPFSASIPMCEILEIENGQVKSSRLFYDTASFPKEAQELMQQMAQQKKAA